MSESAQRIVHEDLGLAVAVTDQTVLVRVEIPGAPVCLALTTGQALALAGLVTLAACGAK